jgi:RNA polymerase sigma-70 factor (ECF subfamily)
MGSGVHTMTAPVGSDEGRRQAAFQQAVSPESVRLYRLALAIVDDPGEAEDAVQDTMLIAWRRWSSLQGYENQSAWLTRVCVRECLRRRRSLHRLALGSPTERYRGDPPQSSYLDGQLLDLHRAYTSLSPAQRAMVTLHLHDGFTVDECAAILGCRPGTARSHLGRAVAKLRKELGHA